ncbi:MAG: DUF2621 family protein [Myxococcota bacterium]
MFQGVSHLEVPVTSLERAVSLFVKVMDFRVRAEGEGWCDVDVNSLLIRFLEVRRVECRASLRIQVSDVEGAWKALVTAGARQVYEPHRTPQLELVGTVADPDGHTLSVWRSLTEDEYGFFPDLPKERSWDSDAEALLKSLLTAVPSLFRGLARRKVVREAESLAGARVGREDVIRGYIRASARVTRYRVRAPLREHGIDPDRYQDDFEA